MRWIKTGENSGLICPNKDCGRAFTKPLSTQNIERETGKTYNACPYCLTELSFNEIENEAQIEKEDFEPELEEKQFFEISGEEDKVLSQEVNINSVGQNDENESDCKYHIGYLGEEKHDQIPDECLVCMKIIECMHQKSKNS